MQLVFASIIAVSLLQVPVTIAVTQGTAPFMVPGLSEPAETWYEVHGDLASDKTPLVILHGGPGGCHDYLKPLTDLDIPLVFYDQIGCGKSTHLQDKDGDEDFWTVDLFKNELDNLLCHLGLDKRPIDLYGHSWGGQLAAEWAASKSCKSNSLRRLVISNSLASMDAWLEGVNALVAELPEDARKAVAEADASGDYTTPEFAAAMDVFYQRHFSLSRPWPPPEVQSAFDCLSGDPTVYGTMYEHDLPPPSPFLQDTHKMKKQASNRSNRYGPSEITATGSLRNWIATSCASSCAPLMSSVGAWILCNLGITVQLRSSPSSRRSRRSSGSRSITRRMSHTLTRGRST